VCLTWQDAGFRFQNIVFVRVSRRGPFYLKTEIPERFPHGEKIEVATLDNSYDAMLSMAHSTLISQDASSVLAIAEPTKIVGAGAFGRLQGSNLFLLDAVASDRDFKNAVSRPNGTLLYIKLRDDPAAVGALALLVLSENQ
jgi:hypothetical protein